MQIRLTVAEGAFEVADELTRDQCRQAKLRRGENLIAEIKRDRNHHLHRAAHRFGQLCRDNIPQFSYFTPHQVIKKLMAESGIGCETVGVEGASIVSALDDALTEAFGASGKELLESLTPMLRSVVIKANEPKSLAFDAMDDTEFQAIFSGLVQYLADTYWKELSPQQIADMAGLAIE